MITYINRDDFEKEPLTQDEQGLIEASIRGDISEAASLLEQGVSIDIQDDNDWTALMHAAANGHAELVRFLIDQGADVQKSSLDFQTAFEIAHVRGFDDVLSEFSRFEPQELVCEGTLRWYCPFCGHWAFLGDPEERCKHFFAAGGMWENWPPEGLSEGLVPEMVSVAMEWLRDDARRELLFENVPAGLRHLFELIDDYEEAFWQDLPDLHRGEYLEIDEAAGTFGYWDYFALDPQAVIENIGAQAQEALVFLKELASGVKVASDGEIPIAEKEDDE